MPISPKELVERVIEEIYNQGNLDLIDELYSPDIVREVLPMPPIVGREAMRQYVEANPQGRHGAHTYRAADFGLDPAELDAHFAAYREAVGVPAESTP